MGPQINPDDPLSRLDIFDPDSAKMVREELQTIPFVVSVEDLSFLVEDTIWALSLEASFGQAVAAGYLSLLHQHSTCLHLYSRHIRAAGLKGPTFGRLTACHLVPVLLCGHDPIRQLFFKTVAIMEKAGAYTLPKPLAVLDRILDADDHRSAESFLRLLCAAFSHRMSYIRQQQLAALLPKVALRYQPPKRARQLMELERVMRIDDRLATALITGMDMGLQMLSVEALSRFVSLALDRCGQDRLQAEKYLALRTQASRLVFDEMQVAVSLEELKPRLDRYLRARTSRAVAVRPLSAIPKAAANASAHHPGTCSDSRFVYLPDEMDRYVSKTENVHAYKCLTRLEAGLHEFGTYRFDLERALEQCRRNVPDHHLPNPAQAAARLSTAISALETFFHLFPEPALAEDLFLIFEHGRIRHLLAQTYPGLLFSCLPLLHKEMRALLSKADKRDILMLLYAAVACEMSVETPNRIGSARTDLMRDITVAYAAAMRDDAPTVETSAQLVAVCYERVAAFLNRQRHAAGTTSYRRLKTPFQRRIRPDLHHLSNLPIEKRVRSLKQQLAAKGFHIYASVIAQHLNRCNGELHSSDIGDMLGQPENYTDKGRDHRQSIRTGLADLASDEDGFYVASLSAVNEPDACPAFWYPEWDCRVEDYLGGHARVMECAAEKQNSDFYETTLRRHAGLVQRIRTAFELLKPQELKWYRRWIEGDEFDYRELLDFALDRKAGRTPSERLYIKRLKAMRDVAVLLLVDLSRSTAHMVAGSDATVLDIEKEAIVLFSEALQVVGDRFAIAGFSGSGRLGVEYFQIKDFGDSLGHETRDRISSMFPRRNTRMGAAIRHAAYRLSAVPCRVKLLIILGDGFPNDLHYKKTYAVEDSRKAISELRTRGIHVHAITVNMNPAETSRLDVLYGGIHHDLISEVTDLPDRLWRIYGALTR